MIILGNFYKFSSDEKFILNNLFNNCFYFDDFNGIDDRIIEIIENYINQNNKTNLIVLNTNKKISDKIIKYLTNIQFEKTKNVKIISIENFIEKYFQKCFIPENNNDLHFLNDIKNYSNFQYYQKRIIDYLGFFVLFFVFLIIFPIYVIKMLKQSKGSIFFIQKRIGKNGIIFNCYKFRTMDEKNNFNSNNLYTQDDDKRIFPFAKFMRKTRLDELPQIFNVLKGEMHLIGPRAEWNLLVEKYEKEIPYYQERHIVSPGISGLAQVNYKYGQNNNDTKQKLMYDLFYIKKWNIFLEIKIIFKTILIMLKQKGI